MTPEQITEALSEAIVKEWGRWQKMSSRQIAAHLTRDVVLPLIEQETAQAKRDLEGNVMSLSNTIQFERERADTAERLLVSLLADLTEQYEKAREERDQHDEYSNYWRWLDGICEGLDRAIQRAKYPPDTTTNEPVEPDPFTDNDTDQEQP